VPLEESLLKNLAGSPYKENNFTEVRTNLVVLSDTPFIDFILESLNRKPITERLARAVSLHMRVHTMTRDVNAIETTKRVTRRIRYAHPYGSDIESILQKKQRRKRW
jgi:hypothetical protein